MRSLSAPLLDIEEDRAYAVLPAGALDQVAAVVADANATAERFHSGTTRIGKNRKAFLQNLLDTSTLDLSVPLLRLALDPGVLSAVATYLGVPPLLTAVALFRSESSDLDLRSSQLFHCDGDDVRQMKVFVHCSDVDEASGPLTVLDGAASATVMDATRYQFRQRLTDDQVLAVVDPARIHAFLGPAGTTVFVDTSRCFHYGSRVAPGSAPRLVAMVQYQTPYSFMLPERHLPFRHLLTDDLPVLQRLALGG